MRLFAPFLAGTFLLSGVVFGQATKTAPATATAPGKWPYADATVVLKDFKFGTGEALPELKLHYITLGVPHKDAAGHVDNAILLLHGTGGDAHSLMNPLFSDVLFGVGAPLDIRKYYLILPDDIGHGESSKPSDGLHMKFPAYDYDDMVRSQKLMLEGMGVEHLRLILGTSMGCMESFVWGETYPGFATALAPFACLPVQIAGRNRMMRYMAIEAVKQDPAWMGGEYKTEPIQGLRTADELTMIMGSSPLQMQKNYPTREKAEKYVDDYLRRTLPRLDANDLIYYFNASRNYDPSAHLNRITVPVLYINSADDFINPPELGIAERLSEQMPRCTFILLPITDATRGHGTHTVASIWKDHLAQLMKESEPAR
jgi:homoserine O-acetyltransferase